ncbi:hypothetical protein BTUL_0124g00110 [Botrytis tulipae]|uniref:Uncharacterized protein n=1 Tax=Botrytis tulipae TaxID=87230 RepID=A0A4Z1EI55_9HELO|nr:hypothetical protein BTUL_0124g00110 [Botrytis tulipae]
MSVMANQHLVQIIITVQALRLPRIFVVEKIRDKIKEDHLLALISGAPGPYSKLYEVIRRDMVYTLESAGAKYPVEILGNWNKPSRSESPRNSAIICLP